MEGLDLGQTSNPSLAWKMDVLKINDDDDRVQTTKHKCCVLGASM